LLSAGSTGPRIAEEALKRFGRVEGGVLEDAVQQAGDGAADGRAGRDAEDAHDVGAAEG
jgi:hypothetical protein